jgi:hypothetical protein
MNTSITHPGSRWIRGAASGLVLSVLAVGALLAGCTHGSGGDGASPAGPVPSGAVGPGTSVTAASEATASAGDAGSGNTAETGGPGTSVPSAVTTAIGAVTTTVTVPPTSDPLGAAPSHPTGSADAAIAAILPGAYGLASLGARVHGATIDLAAQGGCNFALDVIRSGQWALTPVLQPHDGVRITVGVLARGDRRALLSLTESTGLCTGRIVTETQQPLTLTGTIGSTGPAHAVTVSCMANADGPPAHAIIVSYRTRDAALMILVTVPDAVGTHPVDPGDQAGVIVLDPHADALAQAAGVARAFFDPSTITPEAMLPGVTEKNAWFQGKGATVTVTSNDPLTGTLNAPHLRRESGGGSAAFSAGFSC